MGAYSILCILGLFSIATVIVAVSEKRNVIGWVSIALLFPVWGLVLLLVLPAHSIASKQRSHSWSRNKDGGWQLRDTHNDE